MYYSVARDFGAKPLATTGSPGSCVHRSPEKRSTAMIMVVGKRPRLRTGHGWIICPNSGPNGLESPEYVLLNFDNNLLSSQGFN
jgi:hypothetical protein